MCDFQGHAAQPLATMALLWPDCAHHARLHVAGAIQLPGDMDAWQHQPQIRSWSCLANTCLVPAGLTQHVHD